jgi:hypothetical protein
MFSLLGSPSHRLCLWTEAVGASGRPRGDSTHLRSSLTLYVVDIARANLQWVGHSGGMTSRRGLHGRARMPSEEPGQGVVL